MNSNQTSQGNKQSDKCGSTGSQTGSEQKDIDNRVSNEAAGGLPKSPRGKQLSADENMNDDTGLSNRANRQSAEPDTRTRQMEQSNVGRRDDGTPD